MTKYNWDTNKIFNILLNDKVGIVEFLINNIGPLQIVHNSNNTYTFNQYTSDDNTLLDPTYIFISTSTLDKGNDVEFFVDGYQYFIRIEDAINNSAILHNPCYFKTVPVYLNVYIRKSGVGPDTCIQLITEELIELITEDQLDEIVLENFLCNGVIPPVTTTTTTTIPPTTTTIPPTTTTTTTTTIPPTTTTTTTIPPPLYYYTLQTNGCSPGGGSSYYSFYSSDVLLPNTTYEIQSANKIGQVYTYFAGSSLGTLLSGDVVIYKLPPQSIQITFGPTTGWCNGAAYAPIGQNMAYLANKSYTLQYDGSAYPNGFRYKATDPGLVIGTYAPNQDIIIEIFVYGTEAYNSTNNVAGCKIILFGQYTSPDPVLMTGSSSTIDSSANCLQYVATLDIGIDDITGILPYYCYVQNPIW